MCVISCVCGRSGVGGGGCCRCGLGGLGHAPRIGELATGRRGVVMARFEVPEGWVAQAYRFALDPTPAQVGMLESHCGAARLAFNHMLGVVKANLDQRSAERSYGIADEDLTPAQGWSLAQLRKTWNARKSGVAPWWQANSKEAYNSGLDGLARALANWSTSRSGERAGAAVGFPRLKTRHRGARSVRFTTGAIRIEADRHHVTLPRIGRVRTHESTRKLARRLQAGTARILSATVRYTGGRWQCAFQVIVAAKSRPGHARRSAASGGGCGCRGQGSAGGRHRRRRGGRPHRGAQTVDPGAVAAAGGPTASGAPVWPLRSRHADPPGAVETLGAGQRPGGPDSCEGGRDPGAADPPSDHCPGDPPRGRRGRAVGRQEPGPARRAAQTRPQPGARRCRDRAASAPSSATKPAGMAPRW